MAGAIDLLRSDESRAASEALKGAQGALGQDAFLKLLLTELRYQDALEPVKDKDFIAQLAQFSSLEQMETLSTAFDRFVTQSGTTQVLGLLGRRVKATTPDGLVDGVAVGVRFDDGKPSITIRTAEGTRTAEVAEITEVEVIEFQLDDPTAEA